MLRRIIYTKSKLKCCRDVGAGETVVYSPSEREFIFSMDEIKFFMSLDSWKNKYAKILRRGIKKLADEECGGMGTPFLCFFSFVIVKVEEIVIDIIPEEVFVAKNVERILKMRSRGTAHIYGLSMKDFNERMKDLDYTAKQAAELLRLYKLGIVKTK